MNRLSTVTEKIDRDKTGLRGALYVHVSHTPSGSVRDIRLSYKWKDDGTMDKVLMAIGDGTTDIVNQIQGRGR